MPEPHPGLRWLAGTPAGRAWLAGLPRIVDDCAAAWSLTPGEPFPYASASLAVPAGDAVLKIQFPDRESEQEAAALIRWAGDGAVRLLAHDPARRALLLERCVPGTPLAATGPDAALDVLVDLLGRLSVPMPVPGPFTTLADEAAHWSQALPATYARAGEPFERRLLDAAVDLLTTLPATQGPPVLLNQDLHAGNVLRAAREPWLVIDPKPVVGEREFAITAAVRGAELGHSERLVRRRLDRLVDGLGLDADRARGWVIAQTLAWCFEGDRVLDSHLDVARWLLG